MTKPHLVTLAILVIAFLLVAPFFASLARAHEPWTGFSDPATGENCCSGKDCGMIRLTPEMIQGDVVGGREGVWITLTREQMLAINAETRCQAAREFIPQSRIQRSPVGGWGICIRYDLKYSRDPGKCIRCVFAPPNI